MVVPEPVVVETPRPPPVVVMPEPVIVETPRPPPVVVAPEPVIPTVAVAEPVVDPETRQDTDKPAADVNTEQ